MHRRKLGKKLHKMLVLHQICAHKLIVLDHFPLQTDVLILPSIYNIKDFKSDIYKPLFPKLSGGGT